jgi:uncharacterized protein (TIGR02001 family)
MGLSQNASENEGHGEDAGGTRRQSILRKIAMLTSIRGLFAATLLAGTALAATPAFADETAPPSDITVSGYVQGVTDYRFRGLSQTAGDFAIQGSINVNHSSGLYVGTWASNLEDSAVYGSTELDVYAGWTGAVASGVTVDAGLLMYVYPNGHVGKANYFEPYASVTTTMGPVSAKLGMNYAWKQASLGNDDNLYLYGELSGGIPETPVSLSAHLGYASGVQSPNLLTLKSTKGGFDYSVGATYNITSKLALGVSYVGVDGNSFKGYSDDTVMASLKLSF